MTETRTIGAHHPGAGLGGDHSDPRIDGGRVHDDELVLRSQSRADRDQGVAQEVATVARADDDADATRVVGVRAVVVSAWEPWRLTDGTVWLLHHHLRWLAGRHDLTVLAAGAPAVEAPVPENVRTLPASVPVRWFGTDRPPALDYASRWLTARRTGEPMHVSYVERPLLIDALRAEIERDRPEIVHAFGWGTGALWRHVGGVPVVHVVVDAWHRNTVNRRLPAWRRVTDIGEMRRIRAHEQRHYPHNAATVVVAPTDAEELRTLAPTARIEVVANGVDAGPPATPPAVAPVLGFHGAFEARHNSDAARVLVNDVLPRVRAVIPDARALLVGRSPDADVRRLVGNAVELRADVPEVRSSLDDMAVYVAPLVSGWGIKNKVLEAMAAGRPVVTTSLGAAGIGAGPGLVVADEPQALAEEVIALLSNRERLTAEGAAGRERVMRDFTWEQSAAAIEQLWYDVSGFPDR